MTFWDTTKAVLTRPLFGATKAATPRLPLPRGNQSGWGWGFSGLLGTAIQRGPIDYRHKAGDISQNSAVASCLQWITTSWPAQTPEVVLAGDDQADVQPDHPFLSLLAEPNDQYGGVWLQKALLEDYWTHGRAYVHIVADDSGVPIEFEYMPAHCTRAKPGQDGRLDHYEYKPAGTPIKLAPETVLHFRFGIDPHDVLEGKPPLAPAYPEIAADNELSGWSVALAENSGVPSGILSPKSSGPDSPYEPVSEEDGKVIKASWRMKTTGPNRGDVLVMPLPLDYTKIAFSPKEMSVAELRQTPEERICALFQIPPGVVGLGAGLERNTFSNYDSSKKAAWEDNLCPTGDYFASVWTKALRMFPGSAALMVRYSRRNVRVLHEDESEKFEGAIDQHAAGLITLSEARSVLGYETDAKTLAQLAAEKPAPPPLPAGDGAIDGKSYAAKSYLSRGIRPAVKKKALTSPA